MPAIKKLLNEKDSKVFAIPVSKNQTRTVKKDVRFGEPGAENVRGLILGRR